MEKEKERSIANRVLLYGEELNTQSTPSVTQPSTTDIAPKAQSETDKIIAEAKKKDTWIKVGIGLLAGYILFKK
ncbi:hypothetical protein SAMN05444369_11019 [Capnocytophaga haemolytica]|jgi:hypothetical protein|uniref:Uncharacterized protein n=1 Tax=Capnocytophaga haemolytica TaxID=45243 RepID=A0AAX2GU99_9FLAO|nr:hypothetical protein [Capnocytophaga haemolytica]AMD85439.1 hypothetical protein AXF12_07885 [Capnocytophaga haemolytica]SFO12246.1 hypothetical protein SAMN05444369_11019 [Capnocytophaga haemolytica]SNV01585.1 Uncharacterised protein [Capnocytophaga haemolytica]